MAKVKAFFPPEHPKQCPRGHKHLSWTMGDDHVFCWDCNQRYPVLECFRPPERDLFDSEKHNE